MLALQVDARGPGEGGAGTGSPAGGGQSSIATALKMALAGVLRCGDPKVGAWRKKLGDALHAMGAGALADAALKQATRWGWRAVLEEHAGNPGRGGPNGFARGRREDSIICIRQSSSSALELCLALCHLRQNRGQGGWR